MKVFRQKTKGSDVIAMFLTLKKSLSDEGSDVRLQNDENERKKYAKNNDSQGNFSITVEYFNKKQLRVFLTSLPQPKHISGVLQRFVLP